MSSDVFDEADPEAAAPAAVVLPSLDEFRSMSGYRRDDAYLAIEREVRRLSALQAAMVAEVASSLSFLDDRHHSPGAWVQAVANCTRSTAKARVRTAALLTENPMIAVANDVGDVGVDQLRCLAAVYANDRARPHMPEAQDAFVDAASGLTARDFDLYCKRWLAGADPDGAHRDHELSRENRRMSLSPLGAGFMLRAEGDAMSGEILAEVLDAHADAEFARDIADRLARYGPDAVKYPLARTARQRRFDALIAIMLKAAGSKDSTDREPLVTIHCNEADLADAFRDLFDTDDTCPSSEPEPAPDPDRRSVRLRYCETASGVPVSLRDLAVAALLGSVQRVIDDKAGRVINLGRSSRLFRGATREAVLLAGDRCCWPGCELRSGRIQIDHMTSWAGHHGLTASLNGAPMCGHHNRAKHIGLVRVHRDEHGWHLHRPDGTEIARRGPP